MAVFKCKMCGGDLEITEESKVAECGYCGTMQTVPTADDEKKMSLFTRANKLRAACDFDKAAGIYESIVAEFPDEAEAYWGLILCKYGIEYVDDPLTDKKIPTCHRSSFDALLDSNDFEMVMENADIASRKVYREEAKVIEDLRKSIVEISAKEEPYDIFICYKETDENGSRTIDSVIAQDVYDELTSKGYRVFFSRITLEDKLGQEYEPYIFAALNSAKIMLAFGTDYEYYNAVWVKNEWSRFLQLIAKGEKKTLIPCYKNIDAYDMPKEFAKLQAQDMGKVGAIQDLLRGIEKIIPSAACKKKPAVVEKEIIREIIREQIVAETPAADVSAPLQYGWDLLSSCQWVKANEQFDRVLQINGKCGEAYTGKLCARFCYRSLKDMRFGYDDTRTGPTRNYKGEFIAKGEIRRSFGNIFTSNEYKKALEYADTTLREELELCYNSRKKKADDDSYETAIKHMKSRDYEAAIRILERIKEHKDSEKLLEECKKMLSGGMLIDEELSKRLREIRKRNAPVQHQMIYGFVGTDGIIHKYYDAEYLNRTYDDMVSTLSVRCEKGNILYDHKTKIFFYNYVLKTDGSVCAKIAKFDRDLGIDDPFYTKYEKDIVRLVSDDNKLLLLDKNGTLRAKTIDNSSYIAKISDNPDWEGITDVTLKYGKVIGLKKDGTVVVAAYDKYKVKDYDHWKNIAALVPDNTDFAITVDGRIVTRKGYDAEPKLFDWTEVVAFNGYCGLRADGTVLCLENELAANVKAWTDIVAISGDHSEVYGIKADGTVLYASKTKSEQMPFRLFNSIDTIYEERKQHIDARIAAFEKQCEEYRQEMDKLKGIFRKKERERIYDLLRDCEKEIDKLKKNQVNIEFQWDFIL